jgi:FAD/FMN-containing dehydrogenase
MLTALSQLIKGDVDSTNETLTAYSHDASLFEIKPAAVVFPKDVSDICALVEYVRDNKTGQPQLSLTARSGGTDMSGGAINDSIILAFERYFDHVGLIDGQTVAVQPGVYYRNFEIKTLQQNLILPSYPASREICMIGGMVANNAGGEKSLIYGKTDRYVRQIKIVLSDGREHSFRALSKAELQAKLMEQGLEGDLYRKVYRLVTENTELIRRSKPKVRKNSTGYNVWDVWDGNTFDMTKLIVGSQGTLGIITEVTFELVPAKPLSGMMVVFLPSLKGLGNIINALLPLGPSSMESFDDHTLKFAFRFFYSFRKTLGWKKFLLLGISFIPVLNKLLRYLPHFPKIVMLVEFESNWQEEINRKMEEVRTNLAPFEVETQIARDKKHEEKFWTLRRESFNLLRQNIKGKHTAPFIDDLIVPPQTLPEFFPKLVEIMERYQLLYTIAGHMGDGNFHIIPLMDLTDITERKKIPAVLEEVTTLVLHYGGSLSGEHNDGLIRGPFLARMYPFELIQIFQQIKTVFDPQNIFNPHKKVTSDWDYSMQHIRQKF